MIVTRFNIGRLTLSKERASELPCDTARDPTTSRAAQGWSDRASSAPRGEDWPCGDHVTLQGGLLANGLGLVAFLRGFVTFSLFLSIMHFDQYSVTSVNCTPQRQRGGVHLAAGRSLVKLRTADCNLGELFDSKRSKKRREKTRSRK